MDNCFFKSSKRWNTNDLHRVTNTICTTTIHNLNVSDITSSTDEYLSSCKLTSCRTSSSYQSCIVVFLSSTRVVTITSTVIKDAQFGNSIQSMIVRCLESNFSSCNANSISSDNISDTNTNTKISSQRITCFSSDTTLRIVNNNFTNEVRRSEGLSCCWVRMWIVSIKLWIKIRYWLSILFILEWSSSRSIRSIQNCDVINTILFVLDIFLILSSSVNNRDIAKLLTLKVWKRSNLLLLYRSGKFQDRY